MIYAGVPWLDCKADLKFWQIKQTDQQSNPADFPSEWIICH